MAGKSGLDRIDARLLELLQEDGRRPYAELGAAVGISGPAAHERVKKLEARGVITGYGARVSAEAVGQGSGLPGTQGPGLWPRILGDFCDPRDRGVPPITGEADYLLKMRARDTRDLERVIRAVQATRHVFSTETDVVFSTSFERRPIRPAERP
jgi:DNA-binding Lrp family transcriptional regulator